MADYRFAESVAEGHPDKVADRIADAILDAFLLADPRASVACDCLLKNGMIIAAGEVITPATVNIEQVVRRTLKSTGYSSVIQGLNADTCGVITLIRQQQPSGLTLASGANNQSVTFGYACGETPEYMPAAQLFANRLMARQALLRTTRRLPFLLPDARCQLTLRLHRQRIQDAAIIVFSTQHTPDISLRELREAVTEEIVKPVMPAAWLTKQTRYLINPAGRFTAGNPATDCGMTGRMMMSDTYGCAVSHGGEVLSGKDPSRVVRSGAYIARYLAKNIVAAGLAPRCEIQLAWAPGISHPVAMRIDTFGCQPSDRMEKLVNRHFDLDLNNMIHHLDLLTPRYCLTACYGHFGRDIFPWENTDKAAVLRDEARHWRGA